MSSKSKEHLRRCLKCGCSPAMDPSIAIFRFPKPGKTNTLRCELWAQFCFPDGEWFSPAFQMKLYNEHKVLCSKHFKQTSFSDYPTSFKKLHRHAVPEISMMEPQLMMSEEALPGSPAVLKEISNLIVPETSKSKRSTSDTHIPSTSCTPAESFKLPETASVTSTRISETSSSNFPSTSELNLSSTSCTPPMSFKLQETGSVTSTHISEKSSGHLSITEAKPSTCFSPAVSFKLQETASVATTSEKQSSNPAKGMSMREKKLFLKCKKNVKKVWALKQRIKKMKNKQLLEVLNEDESVNELVKKLTPTFALMLQSQIRNFKKKVKGRRWTTEEKIVALQLFKRSPTCYRLMRRLFYLPAQSTLKSLLSRFDLEVGVNKIIFNVLKEAAKKEKASDNEYILTFDEMSIRKNLFYNRKKDNIEGYQDHAKQGRCNLIASHALVFLISGIRKKRKQPIAFYLSSGYVTADRMAVLIKEILQECLNAGISIAATVCDMDGVNRRALSILGATAENPCIKINNMEVVTIFDPPHLLKCFRNLFLKYNIQCITDINSENKTGVGLAKWSHIKEFYNMDSNNKVFVYAPALKMEHLDPNSKQKMRVKLAAQVLSHTVSAGMMAKIAEGSLSTEAVVTVNVLENMDKIFDTLNSDSTDLRRGKIFSTNLKNSTPHLDFINKMKMFFKHLKFVGCNRAPPSQEGWIWTLNAVEQVWKNLTKKHKDLKSLATRRLQQDPLENLFGCIRGNCGANVNPTTGQFVAALKTAMLTNLAHQGVGNCENDQCSAIINNYKMILSKPGTNLCSERKIFPQDEDEGVEEYAEEVINGEINACAYVCGFLYNKIENNCNLCSNILLSSHKTNVHVFTSFKEYRNDKESLKYCSISLINYVEHCATTASKILEESGHEIHIYKNIFNQLCKADTSFLKQCPDHWEKNKCDILKNIIHICIKRFCVLKNREFVEDANKKALKRKIEILQHK